MLKFTLFIISFILMHNLSFAQTVVRQSIGTLGKSGSADGVSLMQSTGQPYRTSGASGVQPGFIQSNNLIVEKVTTSFKSDLMLYPNPADQELYIKSSTSLSDIKIRVVDMSGAIIYSTTLSLLDNYKINCENWSVGVYFVVVSDSKNVLKSKVVKR